MNILQVSQKKISFSFSGRFENYDVLINPVALNSIDIKHIAIGIHETNDQDSKSRGQ